MFNMYRIVEIAVSIENIHYITFMNFIHIFNFTSTITITKKCMKKYNLYFLVTIKN